MDETAPTRDDIVNLISSDHETLRRSFEAVAGAAGPDTGGAERAKAFAELEEHHVLPLLSEQLPEDRGSEMGRRYTKARASGPTHPHPSAPDTRPGNLVAGPVAALFDRIRDAASHV